MMVDSLPTQPVDQVVKEPVVEPDLLIVDPHHHLWAHPGKRYLIEEFSADLATGHRVAATVFVECHAMYRKSGPPSMQAVGEAEFVAGMAAMSDSGTYGDTRICAGFVGAADLTLGALLDPVLDALAVASGGRLRGIRGAANWDSDPALNSGVRPYAPAGLMLDRTFRAGVARVASRGLVYDAWQYHTQLAELCDLADEFPDATIVVNHCGGLRYLGAETFEHWKAHVVEVARRPNTMMKLGGLSAARCGFGYAQRASRPTSAELASDWAPYIQTCLELFGPERCMYESNFPPDAVSGTYRTVWNALKLTAAGCSVEEKHVLFSGNAQRIYNV